MTPDRLAEIKNHAETAKYGAVVVNTLSLRDLIAALEAAQERIATLEAEVDEYGDLSEQNLHLVGINIGADRAILRLEGELRRREDTLSDMRQIVESVKQKYDGALEKYGCKAVDDIEAAIEQALK